MHPAYFETLFDAPGLSGEWPSLFAIVTAWATATTGTCLSQAVNDEADRQLESVLQRRGCRRQRITGYSPVTGDAEPCWAVDLPFDEACEPECLSYWRSFPHSGRLSGSRRSVRGLNAPPRRSLQNDRLLDMVVQLEICI